MFIKYINIYLYQLRKESKIFKEITRPTAEIKLSDLLSFLN